jgi:glycosyltransferase involved in cell wall biosynthesis
MACNLPVVCSRAAAVSEVVADAALVADADDHDGLASNVLRAFRGEIAGDLAMRGQRRVAQFTWRRAAERTAAIYVQLLEGAI